MKTFQPTRPLRGATVSKLLLKEFYKYFNPRAPCGARRQMSQAQFQQLQISTHAPLAGRDESVPVSATSDFLISTHAPLAGRDV